MLGPEGGWRGGRCYVNSIMACSREATERFGAAWDGSWSASEAAAEIGVPVNVVRSGHVLGLVPLREMAQLYGYSERWAQQLVTTRMNGTILVSPRGVPWARLDTFTAALSAGLPRSRRRRS